MESANDMSFHRVLVSSFRELLTLAPRAPFTGKKDKTFRRGRLLLMVGIPAALITIGLWVWWSVTEDVIFWQMLDLNVYYGAGNSLERGQFELYSSNHGDWSLPFIYPPFSAYIFYKLPFDFAGLQWAMTVTSFVALVAVVWAAWGMLGHRRTWGRVGVTLLTFAAVVWLEPVSWTLIWGQVNIVLMALVLVDLSFPDARWWKGIGIGIAAGLKLTPAIFVVYLIITRRFRAAGVAIGAFLATVAFGFLMIPRASKEYWTNLGEISNKVNGELSVGTLNNQSVKGMLTRLIDNETVVTGIWLVICAVVVVLGLLAAAKASLAGRELLGVVIVGALSLLVSPISWSHHWVWVVPAFILLIHTAYRRATRLWWAAVGAFFVFYASWPMKISALGTWDDKVPFQPFGLMWLVPRDNGREKDWNIWQFFVGNSYLLGGIVLTVLVSWLVLTNTRLVPHPLAVVPVDVPATVPAGSGEAGDPAAAVETAASNSGKAGRKASAAKDGTPGGPGDDPDRRGVGIGN
ncbi:glycosyltransferase 87 family protein [Yinghuangia sp. ASG 101]|uniref:glycosyltransferase 87 family protein n=1 Tax=Yinghuangia sp. ASG 101 TaxID=2896848 RepID=UPI001E411F4B|nr:glycosyltransferase 87 family protein [Yinghuangia sp. ASG 101]UGQ10759.1 glycosyltransferase 87 family protein [Yinghuangia sp. ASG 101]